MNFGAGRSLSETLLAAIDSIEGDTVTLRQLFVLLGEQGLLVICALLSVPFLIPVSIPGVSTVFGAAIILIGLGIMANRLPWLPASWSNRALDAKRLVPVLRKGTETVQRIERVIHPRLHALTDGEVVARINGLGIVVAGVLLCVPLGLVPFSNTLPAVAILFLSAGISQRDGLFVLAGYAMIVATIIYFGALTLLAFAAGRGLTSIFWG